MLLKDIETIFNKIMEEKFANLKEMPTKVEEAYNITQNNRKKKSSLCMINKH